MMEHFVSGTTVGEVCHPCWQHGDERKPATHKIAEDIPSDDCFTIQWPDRSETVKTYRHPFTAYVCCACFRALMGSAVLCPE